MWGNHCSYKQPEIGDASIHIFFSTIYCQPITLMQEIKRKSSRFFIEEGLLFRRGFSQAPLRYIAGDEVTKVLEEVLVRIVASGTIASTSRLFTWAITGPPYKPMPPLSRTDAKHPKSMATGSTLLQLNCKVFLLFHTRAFDLIGPINPPLRGHMWISYRDVASKFWLGGGAH